MTESTRARRWTASFLLLAALAMGLAACSVTVGDLEKWRNRRGSEEKFVEWMLEPGTSPEVRVKAIEMLVEQFNYEGADNLPRVADLPQAARDLAIVGSMPHMRELFEGAVFSLGGEATGSLRPVQVRDAAIMLLRTTETAETHAAIQDAVLIPWLEEHYRPCITSTGRHPNSRVLSMVGPVRGLPVVVRYLRDGTMDDIICQNSYLAEVSWLAEVSEELATAYTERWSNALPDTPDGQRQFVAAMVTVPESRVLKNWMFDQLLEMQTPLLPDVVDAFLDYVRPLTDASDAERYAAMIQRFDGFLRWIGFQNVVRLRGAEGISQALGAIPDVGVWGRWGGENLDDGLYRAATWVCERPQIQELGEAARQAFEGYLESTNLVARAIAIHCLGSLGNEASVVLLQPSTELDVTIPSWSLAEEGDESEESDEDAPTGTTVGELTRTVIERIQTRATAEETEGDGGDPDEGEPG